jgi:ParB family chromosome partitioning protein
VDATIKMGISISRIRGSFTLCDPYCCVLHLRDVKLSLYTYKLFIRIFLCPRACNFKVKNYIVYAPKTAASLSPYTYETQMQRKKNSRPNGIKREIEPRLIPITKITVGERRPPLVEKNVAAISASMKKVGQLQNIIVKQLLDGSFLLIAGWHRLEAAKRLGNFKISAVVMDGSNANALICADIENLQRNNLRALAKAEAIERIRRNLVRDTQKESKIAGGRQPRNSGINKTAQLLGMTKESVRRAKSMASITPKAKTALVERQLNTQSALLEIAKLPKTAQLAAVEALTTQKVKGRRSRTSGAAKTMAKPKMPKIPSPALAPSDEVAEPFGSARIAELKALKLLFRQSCKWTRKRFARYVNERYPAPTTVAG